MMMSVSVSLEITLFQIFYSKVFFSPQAVIEVF